MTTETTNPEQSRLKAGQRLRQARDSAGLSVADLATQLNLRVSVVTAIDACEYSKIDSELFLKGYVRAYAARVGVDGDSVIRQLDQELEPARKERQAQVESNPLVYIERRKRLKKRIARVVIVLLLLVSLVYVGSFYLKSLITEDMSEEAPAETSVLAPDGDLGDTAPAPESDMVSRDQDEPQLVATEQAVEAAAQPVSSSAETTSEPETMSADADTTAVTQADNTRGEGDGLTDTVADDDAVITASEEAPMIEDPDLALSAVDSVAAPEPADAGETSATVPTGQSRLRATFTDDCWVEVSDASGRTLVASLRRSGETLDIAGTAPMRVVLGAADAVSSMSFSGDEVDISQYPARNNRVVMTLAP
ncbi:RodZ domain-containing protein [uncultured Marinobacter sp.]|uniref:RodZ domain-containing protein n=1 Tax=uncultured Marinobacter sp. TaxID=187379 RepID=UPI0030D8F6B3